MTSYQRLPIAFARGEGAWLWDERGDKYLDAISGIAVCGLGHAHPAVARALCEQADQLVHTSNLYRIPLQERLGARLIELSGMDKVFFCNSGAEANEAAIKIARLYARHKQIETPQIVVMEGSFHGRTLATLSATGNPKVRAGFEPLLEGFTRIPYQDVDALVRLADDQPDIVAVLVEPLQGEGGVMVPRLGYLRKIRSLCDQLGWLLMLDEVQTGMCRTGRWFAYQHEDILPDVMTLAKALGNGVPIGACLGRGIAADLIRPGQHGSTFGGNPLACRAALAVVETLEQEHLAERAARLGTDLLRILRADLLPVNGVREVRGKGLMLGIELDRPCGELVGQALEQRLLINVTAERVIRLLPPLIINDAEAEQIANTVVQLVKQFLNVG
jgi:acetylornithine aminotransferase